MGPWNPSPSSESQRLRNLYESIGMPCSVVILLFYAASSERFRKLRKHFFLFPACAKNPLQYTGSPCPHTVTGFCRCFAFQIGKIRDHNGIIRNFQFRKFLPAISNKKSHSYHYIKFSPNCNQTFGENKNFSPVPFLPGSACHRTGSCCPSDDSVP